MSRINRISVDVANHEQSKEKEKPFHCDNVFRKVFFQFIVFITYSSKFAFYRVMLVSKMNELFVTEMIDQIVRQKLCGQLNSETCESVESSANELFPK